MINGLIVVLIALVISSCAGADKKTFEDGWVVLRNECGDISSMVRNKKTQLHYYREVTLFSISGAKIIEVDIKATRGGVETVSKTYDNKPENKLTGTKKIATKEISDEMSEAVDTFYGQPGKSKTMDQACLFKGFRHD